MPGLTVVHLEPTPNDRDPVGHMPAPTDHAPSQNTRKFASLPISASCGVEAGNIMLPLGISPLYVVSERPRPAPSQDAARHPTGSESDKGDDTIMTVGAES